MHFCKDFLAVVTFQRSLNNKLELFKHSIPGIRENRAKGKVMGKVEHFRKCVKARVEHGTGTPPKKVTPDRIVHIASYLCL